jgi:hypothetical protein
MHRLWILLAGLAACSSAQDTALKLNLVVVEGEGAINNIRQRTAREPIVQVEDQNHKPVAGAAVVFALPSQGASGTFAGGEHSITVISDSQGRAVARGFKPNQIQGQYQIHVNASFAGATATVTIATSNAIAAGAAGAVAGGISAKVIIIAVVAAAAATTGGLYASGAIGGGGSNNNATIPSGPTLISISPGTGTVGPPR